MVQSSAKICGDLQLFVRSFWEEALCPDSRCPTLLYNLYISPWRKGTDVDTHPSKAALSEQIVSPVSFTSLARTTMLCNAKLPSGMLPVRGHRLCRVRVKAKITDVINKQNMLLQAGFTAPQTDILLQSFLLSDDAPPSRTEVTLELFNVLEPIKISLDDLNNKIQNLDKTVNNKIDKLGSKVDSNTDKVLTRMNIVTGVLILVLLVAIPRSLVVPP